MKFLTVFPLIHKTNLLDRNESRSINIKSSALNEFIWLPLLNGFGVWGTQQMRTGKLIGMAEFERKPSLGSWNWSTDGNFWSTWNEEWAWRLAHYIHETIQYNEHAGQTTKPTIHVFTATIFAIFLILFLPKRVVYSYLLIYICSLKHRRYILIN